MGNYTILGGVRKSYERQASKNLTTNAPKILDLKSSSEQIFSKNCRWVPLKIHHLTGYSAVKDEGILLQGTFLTIFFAKHRYM